MINQTSYERFGDGLYSDAEVVVYSILVLAYFVSKKSINFPKSVYMYQKEYNNKVEKIASDFETNWKEWAMIDLASAYLAGLKQSEKQLVQLGLSKTIKNQLNNLGTSLLRGNFNGNVVPPKIKEMFKDYPQHLTMYGAFRKAVESSLQNQKFQIVRKSKDIFRDIAINVGNKSYRDSDIFVRRRFSQELLNQYARKGIQTITYKNGSRYSIDTYCEMLGRTMAGRAAVQASLNRFYESGYNLVTVSSHFRACDLCTPYEGVTLSIEKHPIYESIADAELQGLFHPNCKHDVSVYWEGKTQENNNVRVDSGEQQLIDKYGYEDAQKIAYSAQQKQRYIERNIRKWKRVNKVALDNKNKEFSNFKIKEWQKKQREHLKENTFLPRKYSREQVNVAI